MAHGYALTALPKYLRLHPSTLSRIVKRISKENRHAENTI